MKCWHSCNGAMCSQPLLKVRQITWNCPPEKWVQVLFPESESRSVVSDSLRPHGLHIPWNSPGHNTGVGSCSLLPKIFSTQGLNLGLPRCRRILYPVSHQGSPRTLESVAYPFSSSSSWPRNRTRVSCIADRFFPSWATREAHSFQKCKAKIKPHHCFN